MLSPIHRSSSDIPQGHPCSGCPVRDIAICGALEEGDLKSFRRLGCQVVLKRGDVLFRQGEAAHRVFTITEGMLKSYRIFADGRRQVVGFHLPGEFIGMAVDEVHAASVEALQECRVCAFPLRRFENFVDEHAPMERELYIAAARDLAEARKHVVMLGRKTAVERVASFFLALSKRSRDPQVLDLPMDRTDIADFLGLTKETVSRILAELKSRRLIRLLAVDRIQILEMAQLKQVAAGADGDRAAA
jgi:CRP/FNR family transcriptional regulator